MDLQKLYSYTRKAVDEYALIEEGDHIAIGVSGGKDSLTLLYALHGLQRFYPKHFDLQVITVDLGYEESDFSPVEELCEEFQVPYHLVATDIGKIVFQDRKESNPCALCAKMRKGALNDAALKAGCNKIAYAHQKDDLVETMLLSLLFEGRFYAFSPRTYLDRTGLTVIRPLLFVEESDVIRFRHKYQLPVIQNPCPADGHTERQYAKELLAKLEKDHPGTKQRMFSAILNGKIEGWPKRIPRYS